MQDCSLHLEKANLMQKICKRIPCNFWAKISMKISFGQVGTSQNLRGNTDCCYCTNIELQFMECLKVVVEPKQYSVHCCLRNYVERVIFVFGSLFITDYVS